jgi:hypothetical protein
MLAEYLAMTDLLACGEDGLMSLWNEGLMSVVPGIARRDGFRSHFRVKDAAAKGVSVQEEQTTRNGWLGKAIFAANNLYCTREETAAGDCPPAHPGPKDTVDGISFAQAAAGPDALMVSHKILQTGTYIHLSGQKGVEGMASGGGNNYISPFGMMPSSDGLVRPPFLSPWPPLFLSLSLSLVTFACHLW